MKDKGPLSGIKVIDLTAMVSGPSATMILGDQGADIIKVEPLEGELMRKVGNNINGITDAFLCCNRSKRSLTLNLKNKEAIEILKNLITSADVFIQNFRPGAIERMGLAYEQVKYINNNIIYTSISGFGKSGPLPRRTCGDSCPCFCDTENPIKCLCCGPCDEGGEEKKPAKKAKPAAKKEE